MHHIDCSVSNYVMIIGKKSDSLEYRAGYYGEKLVLFAHITVFLRTMGYLFAIVPFEIHHADSFKNSCPLRALGSSARDKYLDDSIFANQKLKD